MVWAANAEHEQLAITTAMVLHAYSDLTGYDPDAGGPGGDPTDRGTVLLDALKYWRRRGIDRQTIKAFVEVDPRSIEHAELAIDLFGCLYVGVELPDASCPASRAAALDGRARREPQPRTRSAQRPLRILYGIRCRRAHGGHLGTKVTASWECHTAYCDEFYAMLSPAWLRHDPQGIDVATLTADLDHAAVR